MFKTVIQVEGVSKKYEIGKFTSGSLRETLANLMRFDKMKNRKEFWALQDVSFSVKQGEIIGIIGRNGAGKSTLLKILSRITMPSKGRIELNGRVASLLEVGTGFHPELTGRENVFLNGSLLGMTRKEIKQKFDEIVAFSGVEKFIDTPVKRYSSGMYVRLAFAVAAHLEPEILLIDEVLAVGDEAFRKKCLKKMGEITGSSRTILFVSHNLDAVKNLCPNTILLENGYLKKEGPTQEIIRDYLASFENFNELNDLAKRVDRKGGDIFRFEKIVFQNRSMHFLETIQTGAELVVEFNFSRHKNTPISNLVIGISFFTVDGKFLFACRNDVVEKRIDHQKGSNQTRCIIPKLPLKKGKYYYNVIAYDGTQILDWVKQAGYIDVEFGKFYPSGIEPAAIYQGVCIEFDWE